MKYLPKRSDILLLLLIALLLASSCTHEKTGIKVSDFNAYLANTSITKPIMPNALYIIMPSSACPGCITEIFDLLKSRAATPSIILIGVANTKSGLAGFFTDLETYTTYHDTQNTFVKIFAIRMDKPYYILIEKGRIAQQGSVSPENLEILEAIILRI